MATKERFYVYKLIDDCGVVQYVGKGSGYRLRAQQRRYGLQGEVIERFTKERDAYKAEVRWIASLAPPLNKHPGGNGSWAIKRREHKTKEMREIERIGTRAYAARILLRFDRSLYSDPSKLEAIRQVAYG
jgi:hypothetical protein